MRRPPEAITAVTVSGAAAKPRFPPGEDTLARVFADTVTQKCAEMPGALVDRT